MPTGTIPKTIEAAKTDLGYINTLLTANEWLKAAIVYAFTRDGTNADKAPGRSTSTTSLMPREFAALGIVGLKSDRTVRGYRAAWKEAMKQGYPDVKPGDEFSVPDLDWPPGAVEQNRGSHATEAREYIARNPEVAVEAMKAVPAVADAVTTAIANDDSLSEDVTRKAFAKRTGTTDRGRVAPGMVVPTDLNRDLSDTLSRLGTLLRKEDNGEFTVNGLNESWLRIMGLQLNERATSGKADGDLFDQIDALLASARGAA